MRQRDLVAMAALAAERLAALRERFLAQTVLVVAPGPSLPKLLRWFPVGVPTIAVKAAVDLRPDADILYSADRTWWALPNGSQSFGGAKVCSQDVPADPNVIGLATSGHGGYDRRLGWMRLGGNSGCDAVHLAVQLGADRIGLAGFDMKRVNGKAHFYGDNKPPQVQVTNYDGFFSNFRAFARELPTEVEIVNLTPDSALRSFPVVDIASWW